MKDILNVIVFIVGVIFVLIGAYFLKDSELRYIVTVILGVSLVDTAMKVKAKGN